MLCPIVSTGQQGTVTDDAYFPQPKNGYNVRVLQVDGPSSTKSFIRFDLTASLPAGTPGNHVARATLKLYANLVNAAGSFAIYRVTSSWNESGAAVPAYDSLNPVATGIPLNNAGSFSTIDLTSIVAQWLGTDGSGGGGVPNFGIALVPEGPTSVTFDSKESTQTSHLPQLEIVLNHASTADSAANAENSNNANTVTNGIYTTGLYEDPPWISSLAGSKITGSVANAVVASTVPDGSLTREKIASAQVVKSINALRDDVTIVAGSNISINSTANLLTISAANSSPLNPLQIALLRWYEGTLTGGEYVVGSNPTGIAFDGANIWVANTNSNSLTKLRASDGALIGTFALGTASQPWALAFDGSNIWVTNPSWRTVKKLRASDGVLLGTFQVGLDGFSIAFDGANIWVANYSDDNVSKLRASDGALLGTFGLGACAFSLGGIGCNPTAIAFDGTSIWVNTQFAGVMKIRPSDGAVLGTFIPSIFGNPRVGIAFDGANIWAARDGFVAKLRASDGAVLGSFPAGYPQGIAFDGTNIWVVDGNSDLVRKFRASDGLLLGQFQVGHGPQYIAFDGAYVWITNCCSGSPSTVSRR